MQEIYENAKELMKGYCRVCKECNGNACAGEVPGMGGLGTASSFKANINALKKINFNMRLVHDVLEPDTRISVLGKELSIPVLAAPIGGVSFNMGGAISEEAYIKSIIFGCREKGIIGCTGDGVPDFVHEIGLSIIKQADGHGIPFIKPWEDKELFEKLDKAKESNADITGMDIDAAGLITLKKMGRPVSPKTVEKLGQIVKSVSGKFILKGIMTVDDAMSAVDAGADAIVVSNHGGRVLDFTPGAAMVLPDISDAVKGKISILADGGVRTGGDVLKLLALGADAVMIGRPFCVAAVGGLQKGVELYIDKIRTEFEQAMVLTGVSKACDVPRTILHGF
ncbi:MAG: alpha-hydroxy-acid oxidizing protein [Desulfobacula sp.]|uniref:alpha-hydroxy-acid oxidizing protein n=1 Tax=Desulfobacula sp. TaxID=2593537 RepID=UPI0025BBB5D8|nr:alpha-hydroxy-acid oxidizing protein [Desulfobacula sp.]MCD4718949.1 alpha-hydroxy-acid oxidizing protein [Desulfobacula sp.]